MTPPLAGAWVPGELFGIYPRAPGPATGLLHQGPHTGVARLALRTGSPIVPVGIIGSDQVQPRTPSSRTVPSGAHPLRSPGSAWGATRTGPGDRMVLRQIVDEVVRSG